MKPGQRPSFLSPSRWPVRWRLAVVSAGLTFAILLVFAGAVGRLAQDRLEDDFRDELESAASQLAFSIQIDPLSNELRGSTDFDDRILANDATISVVDSQGRPQATPSNPRPLPPPKVGTTRFGNLLVATRFLPVTVGSPEPLYVQYARDHDELDATIGRLWLFLGVGVAGGAILATLAGVWISRRAMRPIADLTATAREIASTRDPSMAMPKPQADDEVAELARTLDSMLAELDAARNEAQQMVQVQREFVADASHELRTPLTSILANLELLHDRLEAEPDGEDAEIVASALRSSRRMRRLVGDLLMLARADAGRFGERRECDLAEVAEAAVAEVRPVANGHRVKFDADAPVPIVGNPDELHRVAVNLLDNAIRHTPMGTTIDVAAATRDGAAVLEVADDGPGLPEGMEQQVFSRFVRGGGPGDVAADAGTGLGLAIVSAVAGSHGGQVEAGRAPSGGARFTVTLPVAEPKRCPPQVRSRLGERGAAAGEDS